MDGRLLVRAALALAAAASLSVATTADAARCSSGTLSGGLHCGCPDPAALAARCNDASEGGRLSGPWTPVIYDLDKPFPPDATTSFVTLRASPRAPCVGMGNGSGAKTVAIRGGYVVGCWSTPDKNGCRTVKVLNDSSMCLDIESVPLGPGCGGACDTVETGQIALSNAGAADRLVCPPIDPALSCRSTRRAHEETFRLWIGGLCATAGCDAGQVEPDTCTSQWGATQWGYNRGSSRDLGPGWYDWKSGAFKLGWVGRRNGCGPLGTCLGSKSFWDQVIVGTPQAGSSPPCLGDPSNPCNGASCTP